MTQMHTTSYCGKCNSVQSCDTSLLSLSILATSRSRSAVSSCTMSSIKPHTCFSTTPYRATRWSPTMPISSHRDVNWPIEASIRTCISSELSDALQQHALTNTDIQLEKASTHKSARTHAGTFFWLLTLSLTFWPQNQWISTHCGGGTFLCQVRILRYCAEKHRSTNAGKNPTPWLLSARVLNYLLLTYYTIH